MGGRTERILLLDRLNNCKHVVLVLVKPMGEDWIRESSDRERELLFLEVHDLYSVLVGNILLACLK